jgi:hypothetical protein
MPGTRLYLELGAGPIGGITALSTADGFVVGPGAAEPQGNDEGHAWILRGMTPLDSPAWAERDASWVCAEGLERTARLRDGWPSLRWLPRAEIFCPSVRYDFVAAAPGEGFSVYRPNTSTIQRYRVADDDDDLQGWLAHARTLGFRTVWLESRTAAERDRGLDLDLLSRARRLFAGGRLWISGGLTETRHIANLAAEGGATAVVVPRTVAERCGCEPLLAALGRPTPGFDLATQGSAARPGAGAPNQGDVA